MMGQSRKSTVVAATAVDSARARSVRGEFALRPFLCLVVSCRSLQTQRPLALLCPIAYSIFRDPVLCEGRTFECDGIVGFWRRRPLADFFGGPQLQRAQLRPDMEMRARVQDWLKQNPQTVPSGWGDARPWPPIDAGGL